MMKRFTTLANAAVQAHRGIEPLTGRMTDNPSAIDPHLLPTLDWPISPAMVEAINAAVSDAIASDMPFQDACAYIAHVLTRHGILAAEDDLRTLMGALTLSVT